MYKAIVIGAGSIGAIKEDKYDSPGGENILTHAHMYHNHPEVELVGIFDKIIERSVSASNKWKCKWDLDFTDIDWEKEQIDIVSICTPTETHKEVLLDILQYEVNPKIVIAEKPFCSNSKEAEEVIEAYKKANIPIIINYPRRYVPEIQQLKKDIDNEKYGKIYSATFHYTRGLRHEMCHGIDLCRFLFGEYEGGHIEQPGHGIPDRDKNDSTYAAYLSFKSCHHIFLSPCDGRQYKVFQLEIMTEKGKIILSQHGMYIDFYPLIEEPIWGGFKILSKDMESRTKTQLNRSLEYLLQNVLSYLLSPTLMNYFNNSLCKPEDALQVHKIIEHLKGE
ncbi:MAG: Gfo/Idh/MocA family oxidoreductase [Melioribacteraceae bacterium]|jgi:predicted dehydrogenase|nr:Gfo/Idh/MocA family oxidoreductase [Melioribacteraceae bacterium]